jgi:protein-S-isoprenylcysteine O-methyltransferase Ste14
VRPPIYVWPYWLLFWSVFLWAYIPEYALVRRAYKAQGASDAKSLQVMTALQTVAFVGAFFSPRLRSLRFGHPMIAFYTGLAVLAAGSLLRRHCFRTLGASFTGDVRARPDQQIVDSGAYRWVRHPSYAAGILVNGGVGIAIGSWLSAALLAVGTTVGFLYRIGVEERALLATVGEPYREYMKTRKRLIPFIY